MAKFIGRDGRYLKRPDDGKDILFETQFIDVATSLARGIIAFHFRAPSVDQRYAGEEFPLVIIEDEEGKVISRFGVKKVEKWDIVKEDEESYSGSL